MRMFQTRRNGQFRVAVVCVLCVICVAGLGYWWLFVSEGPPLPLSFDGQSKGLQNLVVVPTLDTPLPEGKSALWCSSFQMAWNELKDRVVGEPVRIQGAEAIADRLNRAPESIQDVTSDSVLVISGSAADGINDKIRLEMQRKFPNAKMPELPTAENVMVAFAHLGVQAEFAKPFLENSKPLEFSDGGGRKTPVASFGLPPGKYKTLPEVAEQIRVLYLWHEGGEAKEYALDLSAKSQPNQVVVALLKHGMTLADTLSELRKKFEKYQAAHETEPSAASFTLGYYDHVVVPVMRWRVEHLFRDLQGPERPIVNQRFRGWFLLTAYQDIEFRLDAKGAAVESSARVEAKTGGARPHTDFLFDRPYLIYMKKRDAQHPFFVMWVNDADMMVPQ